MSRIRQFIRAGQKPQAGQALAETALILPVLLLLVFGVIETGVYMYRFIQAQHCARESARLLAVRDLEFQSPTACEMRSSLSIATSLVTVGVDNKKQQTPIALATQDDLDALAGGAEVVVVATGQHKLIIVSSWSPFKASLPLGATVAVRVQPRSVSQGALT